MTPLMSLAIVGGLIIALVGFAKLINHNNKKKRSQKS